LPLTWHSLFQTVEGLVAVGTISLAVATAILALVTLKTARRTRDLAKETTRLAVLTEQEVKAVADQADAARQEVQLSRLSFQASIKPSLVDVPPGLHFDELRGDQGRVAFGTDGEGITRASVSARNVGPGIALVQAVTMHWDEASAPDNEATYYGIAARRVIPPGELTTAAFTLPESELKRVKRIRETGKVWIDFDYIDESGTQAETTRLDIEENEHGFWRVTRVYLFHEGDREPYVSSGSGLG
jgi:hypothetical protein